MLAAAVILAATATAAPADLVAAAAASGRPAECRPVRRDGSERTIWTSAKSPAMRSYCRWLAVAHARLTSAPQSAKRAAEEAAKLAPKRAAPRVVLARLALARGDAKAALAEFEAATKLDDGAVEQPGAMHALATAQRELKRWPDALATYRVLAPRVALVADRQTRARVLLEAAHVAMTSGEPRQLEEALAYLRAAMRDPHHPLRHDIALSLVLALDRAGRRAQADAVLADQRGMASFSKREAAATYVAHKADHHLLRGLSLEKRDASAARAAYDAYLAASPSGPFASTAKARRRRLAAPPPKRRRRRRR